MKYYYKSILGCDFIIDIITLGSISRDVSESVSLVSVKLSFWGFWLPFFGFFLSSVGGCWSIPRLEALPRTAHRCVRSWHLEISGVKGSTQTIIILFPLERLFALVKTINLLRFTKSASDTMTAGDIKVKRWLTVSKVYLEVFRLWIIDGCCWSCSTCERRKHRSRCTDIEVNKLITTTSLSFRGTNIYVSNIHSWFSAGSSKSWTTHLSTVKLIIEIVIIVVWEVIALHRALNFLFILSLSILYKNWLLGGFKLIWRNSGLLFLSLCPVSL